MVEAALPNLRELQKFKRRPGYTTGGAARRVVHTAKEWTDDREVRVVADKVLEEAGIKSGEWSTIAHELILYDKLGSAFALHCDQVRHANHVGTLLYITQSSDCRGGELWVVPHEEVRAQVEGLAESIALRESVTCSELSTPDGTEGDIKTEKPHVLEEVFVGRGPRMVFLPLGVFHKVTPLMAGSRVVAKASVLIATKSPSR
jgi:hypothetical protein